MAGIIGGVCIGLVALIAAPDSWPLWKVGCVGALATFGICMLALNTRVKP